MIKKNTVFLNGRKIGTYEFVQKAESGHINFNGFDPYEAKLTDDQQVVLEWLKLTQRKENYPMGTITYIQDLNEDSPYFYAFENLSIEEEFQVLAAFAEWGMANE